MDPFPRLIFIADRFTESRTYERTVAAAEEGLPWVHLRDHRADPELFRDAAEGLIGQIWSANPATLITVNANLEVAAAFETGFHTGRRGPDVEEARHRLGPEALIGYSAHSIEAGTAAERAGADYLFFSPIYGGLCIPRNHRRISQGRTFSGRYRSREGSVQDDH
jgi:thiamine-phosphate pyrophosphorylase